MLDTVESETIRPKLDQAFHLAVTMAWGELRKPPSRVPFESNAPVRAQFLRPDAGPHGLVQIHPPVGDESAAAAVMSQITCATGKFAESKSAKQN